jgi:MYXO-CTERM domain-containing protein
MSTKIWCVIGGLTLLIAPRAGATVMEPDGTPLPQPAPTSELNIATSNGFKASDVTLSGLFAVRGETIDPSKDAHQTPGTFSPQCGFTGQIVLRGGGCSNALGWYNATPGSTTPPPANQIYTLVPANLMAAPPNGISCQDGTFCPLAEMQTDPNHVGQHGWVIYVWNASSISSNPNYKGGEVGFALVGNSGQCTQTKYSEAQLNTISTQYKVPWVTTLIYQSTVNPSAYYIAFEDLPMPASDWKGQGCDGDFNDFVFYVTGLDCEGGGVDCDTYMPGICKDGTTQCSNGGMTITCEPNLKPTAEVCNGLDDDCDGTVDNPDAPNLCPTGKVCSQGTCVYPCTNTEFPCAPPTVCDQSDGLCKDQSCVGVMCGSEQVCYKGTCIGGCEGVMCPPGQVCRIGNCVDPCANVTCDSGQVCDNGVCVPPCSCRACAAGQTCQKDGTCVDTGCDKTTCNPPATVCVKGACQDGCQGVTCPSGQMCSGGQCSTPDGGPIVPEPDGGVTGTGGFPGTGGRTATGGTTGTAGSPATGAGGSGTGGSSGPREGGVTTCNCDASSGPGAGGLALLLAALAIATIRHRAAAVSRRRRR